MQVACGGVLATPAVASPAEGCVGPKQILWGAAVGSGLWFWAWRDWEGCRDWETLGCGAAGAGTPGA